MKPTRNQIRYKLNPPYEKMERVFLNNRVTVRQFKDKDCIWEFVISVNGHMRIQFISLDGTRISEDFHINPNGEMVYRYYPNSKKDARVFPNGTVEYQHVLNSRRGN